MPSHEAIAKYARSAKAAATHKREKEAMRRRARREFPMWEAELDAGFNLMVYGFGSKRGVLNSFARRRLGLHKTTKRKAHVVIVNGFDEAFDAKALVDRVMRDWLRWNDAQLSRLGARGGPLERCLLLQRAARATQVATDLLVVVHSIDAPAMRSRDVQETLGMLAQTPHVSLVASCDHVNAALMWDARDEARFNWVWHHVPTFEPYAAETNTFDVSWWAGASASRESGAARDVAYVMRSFTHNHVLVLKEMARRQLAQTQTETDPTALGMTYRELKDVCESNMWISSDATLRQYLREFEDHKLVVRSAATERLVLDVPRSVLEEEILRFS